MKLFLLLYARSNFNILIRHTCDKDANSNYLNQLTSLHNCLPAKNWWYTEEALLMPSPKAGYAERHWDEIFGSARSCSVGQPPSTGTPSRAALVRDSGAAKQLTTTVCLLASLTTRSLQTTAREKVFYSWGIFQRVGKMLKNDCNAIQIVKKQI